MIRNRLSELHDMAPTVRPAPLLSLAEKPTTVGNLHWLRHAKLKPRWLQRFADSNEHVLPESCKAVRRGVVRSAPPASTVTKDGARSTPPQTGFTSGTLRAPPLGGLRIAFSDFALRSSYQVLTATARQSHKKFLRKKVGSWSRTM